MTYKLELEISWHLIFSAAFLTRAAGFNYFIN